jgi:hypothetical protein
MPLPPISEAFETPEYFAFKEHVAKASVDNSLKVKHGNVVYGKSVKEVPSFRSVDYVKETLNNKKVQLLLQLNDLYDKIVVSSSPEIFKAPYDSLVDSIQLIDAKFDEIDAYIQHQNQVMVFEPIENLKQEIESNHVRTESVIKGVSEDVHVDKSKIKTLLSLHKANMNLEQKLAEAIAVCEMDYVIWPEEKPKENKSNTVRLGERSSRKTRLSSIQKQSIKNSAKQLMKERL